MKVVHLFNPDKGRYPLMINHGLLAHPEIGANNLTTNADVISLGTTHHAGVLDRRMLRAALESADLIFRPASEHSSPEIETWFQGNYADNWGKTIYYDFSDHRGVDRTERNKCRLYLKRTWPNSGLSNKVVPVPLCALPEYLIAGPKTYQETPEYEALYLFHVDILKGRNPNEEARRVMFRALRGCPYVTTGQTTRTGRRDIFLDSQDNPFVEYLHMLQKAKVVVTALPEHGGGDHRIWEALASGTMVFCEKAVSSWDDGLVEDVHYKKIEPFADPVVLRAQIGYYLSESMAMKRYHIGRVARERIQSHNMPINRIEGVLDVLRKFPKHH